MTGHRRAAPQPIPTLAIPWRTGTRPPSCRYFAPMQKQARLDALGRRPRFTRTPTGKRVTPKERDLIWFEKIAYHGPLSYFQLHEFTKHLNRNLVSARNRATDLFHECDTPDGGPYLERPKAQQETLNPRNNCILYNTTLYAERALSRAGRSTENCRAGHWKHQAMQAFVTSTIELGTLADPGLSFGKRDEVLRGKANRIPITTQDPKSGRRVKRTLVPDDVFFIGYGGKHRIFGLEIDRATEQVNPSGKAGTRKTKRDNLLLWREFIGRGLYRQFYGSDKPMMLLTVTTNLTHMQNLMAMVMEISGGRGNNYMLYKCLPDFGEDFHPSKTKPTFFSEPWLRADGSPFRIDR